MKNSTRVPLFMLAGIALIQLAGCISTNKVPKRDLTMASYVKPFDAIVVPGIPFNNGAWDSVMKARVIWSYILYKHGYARNIIYSGSSVYSPYFESKIMGLYAQQLGIPASHIFYETRARHSTENVYYSYLLARELGFKSIALATDPFQSSLLRSFTRKRFATHIYHLPFIKDSIARYNYLAPQIDPATARATDNFISITENETFRERLRGTLGKNIDWKQYPGGKLPKL